MASSLAAMMTKAKFDQLQSKWFVQMVQFANKPCLLWLTIFKIDNSYLYVKGMEGRKLVPQIMYKHRE